MGYDLIACRKSFLLILWNICAEIIIICSGNIAEFAVE